MIFISQMKNLRVYRKPLFLPTSSTDNKKTNSTIFLLSPNYESSKKLMNHNLTINRLRYQSYYIEKDVFYYITGKASKDFKLDEAYIRDKTEIELYLLSEMTADKRNSLSSDQFGLPEDRKYPLDTEARVRSAIRFFNYCSKEKEEKLAKNINAAIKKFNMNVTVGKNNRFKKYYAGTVSEAVEDLIPSTDALLPFIRFSGYESDVEITRSAISAASYFRLLQESNLEIKQISDIPLLSVVVYESNTLECEYSISMVGDRKEIELSIPTYQEQMDKNEYIDIIHYTLLSALHEIAFPNASTTILPKIIEDTKFNLDTVYREYGERLFSGDTPRITESQYLEYMKYGDPRDILMVLREYYPRLTMDDVLVTERTATPITMENINKKFKYAAISKVKRQFTMSTNLKKELEDIKDQFPKVADITSNTSSPEADMGSEVPTEETPTEGFIITDELDIIPLNEANYNSQLRQALYKDRIVSRSALLKYYKKIKEENQFIKYTYLDLEQYKNKNLFIDLSFYNEIYFRNVSWSGKKGYNVYLSLLDRLINDPKYLANGYKTKTIFIPVLDWSVSKDTKMWLYKEAVNPISIIYELLRSDLAKMKSIFRNCDLIFFSDENYFKLSLAEITPKTAGRDLIFFKNLINKMIQKQEFTEDEVDSSLDFKESPEAIKANIIDKIEQAKGIDLTGKEKITKDTVEKELSKYPKSKPVPDINPLRNTSTTKDESVPTKMLKDSIKDKVISKNTDLTNKKADEKELAQLAITIDDISSDSYDTDDALDKMDNEEIKHLLVDLDNMKSNSVKVDATRAARMNELDQKFLDTNIKGKSIRDILNSDTNSDTDKLTTTSIKVDSPNKEWENLTYMNFDKDYDLSKDILACIYHFTKVSRPIGIRNIEIKDDSTSEDRMDLYTVDCEDYRGKRFTLEFDVPKMINNRFRLRGNDKVIQTQFFNMPVLKTNLDACQVISNYQKIFIYRMNNSTGKSYPAAARILRAINKYDGSKIMITAGNNRKISSKYELPIDYIDISSAVDKIYTEYETYYFNEDEIRSLYPNMDDTFVVPFGYNKSTKSILYYSISKDDTDCFSAMIARKLCDAVQFFSSSYFRVTISTNGSFTQCNILNAKVPMIIILGYYIGLTKTLKLAGIDFKVEEKDTEKNNPDWSNIKFSDGYLIYHSSYTSELLLNGLRRSDTSFYSISEIDDRSMYVELLADYAGGFISDGLDNFFDCIIDPMTEENLKYYKLPTDIVSILLYANSLLADNKFVKHTDTTSRRIRRNEMVAAYTYEVLSKAYGEYSYALKHNRSSAAFSVKRSAIIDYLLSSPISSDDSVISALHDVETTNSITFKGKAGLNNDESYSLDKRTYDDSMLNVLAMSTAFSANVGISRQATLNMAVDNARGYIKPIEGDTSLMNAANTLSATEALTPFGSNRDDSTRTNMTFIQTAKHAMRVEQADPLLVTNGADEVLPYLTTDRFAFKAKHDGVIKVFNENMIIIGYKDGSNDYINLVETIEKNSDGGFYLPIKLIPAKEIKLNGKVQEGQIIAYDEKSFSSSLGESDKIAYNIGTLAKVAIINTDDGYEDSGVCTQSLADKLAVKVIYMEDHTLDADSNIYQIAKIGDLIDVGSTLIVWKTPHDEEEANQLVASLANDQDIVSELGRRTIKSEVDGTLVAIKMYRTAELNELSPSLKEIVSNYERPINALRNTLKTNKIDSTDLPATYKLEATGKLKNLEKGGLIECYVERKDSISIGDKGVYFSANKAVYKNIIPDEDAPYTDFRPNEHIDAFVSETSIDKRMVSSTMVYGSIQKLMIELDRSVKDMLGIKYDDSKV